MYSEYVYMKQARVCKQYRVSVKEKAVMLGRLRGRLVLSPPHRLPVREVSLYVCVSVHLSSI